jgi:putative endonuclease
MLYFVYLIKSTFTGKFYIGQTSNLNVRLLQHNDPEYKITKYTKRNSGPWILIYFEKFSTRAEAMRREKYLKSGQGRKYLKAYIK